LDENLLKNNRPVDPSNGSIFLTGGTGFFGPFLIKSILEQNKEFIYVLVRAENDTEGKARLVKAFDCIHPKKELMESFHRRVIPVCGNLNKFKLGLSIKTWEFLSNEIHTIYHNGALVNYLLDYESMKGVNVDGTNEIIRLATSNRTKVLNHISTTFIYGWSVKDILFETDANEKMELLDFGYSQSKWVAEKIVAEAMSKGLPARIFRPALISPAVNGGGHNFDISMRLLVFMLKYGITTTAKNQVSFTPADLCANNIVAISNIEESINKAFQVTRDEYSTLQDVTEILGKLIGKRFDYYNLEDFVPEVISRCQKDDLLFPLLNFLVRSIDNISKMEFKRYDNTNYAKYREQSPWGKKDVSLETVVKGIHLFMVRNDINLN
jgi:thioester reductase-like protein